jgi:hypothetical protein
MFLFVLAAALYVGTVLELLAVKHYDSRLQLLPFALCGIGLLAIAVAWAKPGRKAVLVTRLVMLAIAAGSLWGVYAHIEGNYEFAREIRPRESTSAHLRSAISGRDPLMAPGILAFGAIVTVAATFTTSSSATDESGIVELSARSAHSAPRRMTAR